MTQSDMAEAYSRPLLIADDFGLTPEIDDGIGQLADQGRLSGASAIVTGPDWAASAARLVTLAPKIAVGLHLNLTEGQPLGDMATAAPNGHFPTLSALLARVMTGRIPGRELVAEFGRQIARFHEATGRWPDFIDGHQHVHAMPVIRHATLRALETQRWPSKPLVRIPSDTRARIRARKTAVAKATCIAGLTAGFRRAVARQGFPVHDGFAGVANLGRVVDLETEFARALTPQGADRLLVMCHPARGGSDRLAKRRRAEFDALMTRPDLPDLLFHPTRTGDGDMIDWTTW
ncbi:MAG: ChbG/HpnK family deacetylase [Pseudomonadota bacterium]